MSEEGRRRQADEKRAADADPAAPKTAAARAALPVVPAYTARGGKAGQARIQAEALVRKWSGPEAGAKKADVASAAPAPAKPSMGTRSFGAKDVVISLVLEVTPEQFEELRAELAKSDVTIEAGVPETLRGAATGGGLAAASKDRERVAEQKESAEPEQKLKGGGGAATRKITLYFVERVNPR